MAKLKMYYPTNLCNSVYLCNYWK